MMALESAAAWGLEALSSAGLFDCSEIPWPGEPLAAFDDDSD